MDASVLELLKGVELFSELSDDQLRLLGDLVEVQNFNRDETMPLFSALRVAHAVHRFHIQR